MTVLEAQQLLVSRGVVDVKFTLDPSRHNEDVSKDVAEFLEYYLGNAFTKKEKVDNY